MYVMSPYLSYHTNSALGCRHFSLLIPTTILFIVFCSSVASVAHSAELSIEEKVDQYIENLPDEFNGTILLAIGDTILMNKGYGLANRSFGIPNNSDTKYQLASVSKDFTTILLFKLIEMGLIDLDATIDTYLPEYPKDKASKITIHHLLLHRSGIKHHFQAIPNYFGKDDLLYHTPREYLELFWNEGLAHEPGEGTTYTSPGYKVLALIMERVTGQSFAELLQEYICEPLGMKNTFVDNNLTVYQNLAVGYKKGIDGFVFDLEEEPSNLIGAGDMLSTTGDLFKFQRILTIDNELILSRPYKELLFEEQYKINDFLVRTNVATLAKTPYGEGNDTLTVYGIGTGGNYGFRARLTRLLEIDACYIVLSNVHSGRAMNEQMYSFLQYILCDEAGIPLKSYYPLSSFAQSQTPAEVPEGQLHLYEGFYKTDDGNFIRVFVEDGKLCYRDFESSFWEFMEMYGGELIPADDSTFVDNNRLVRRYFLFVVPERLATEGPFAPLRALFTDIPDTTDYHLLRIQWGAPSRALRWSSDNNAPDINLTEYQGLYYSVEKQKTSKFTINENHLMVSDFLGVEKMYCTPLKTDLFSCEKGFVVFNRYDDGSIRDFRLMSENLDHVYGTLFIKK
jgi:CubicO group peptidase (beta-lactamase class C family)